MSFFSIFSIDVSPNKNLAIVLFFLICAISHSIIPRKVVPKELLILSSTSLNIGLTVSFQNPFSSLPISLSMNFVNDVLILFQASFALISNFSQNVPGSFLSCKNSNVFVSHPPTLSNCFIKSVNTPSNGPLGLTRSLAPFMNVSVHPANLVVTGPRTLFIIEVRPAPKFCIDWLACPIADALPVACSSCCFLILAMAAFTSPPLSFRA